MIVAKTAPTARQFPWYGRRRAPLVVFLVGDQEASRAAMRAMMDRRVTIPA